MLGWTFGVGRWLRCGRRCTFSLSETALDGAYFLPDAVILRRQDVCDGFYQLDREPCLSP